MNRSLFISYKPMKQKFLTLVALCALVLTAGAGVTNTPFFYYYTDGVASYTRILGVGSNPDAPNLTGGERTGDVVNLKYWISMKRVDDVKWGADFVVTGSMSDWTLPFFVHEGDRVRGVDDKHADLIFLDSLGNVTGYITKMMTEGEAEKMQGLEWLFNGNYREEKSGKVWRMNRESVVMGNKTFTVLGWYEDAEADGMGLLRVLLEDGRNLLWQQTLAGKDVYEAVAPKDSTEHYKRGKLFARLVQTDDEGAEPGDTTAGRFRFTAYWMPFMRTMLRYFNVEQLRLMRAEYLARRGFTFDDPQLQAYFNKKKWYVIKRQAKDLELSAQEELMLAEMDCLISISSSSPS